MITVKLMGGLGGQMFIYAIGRKLAHIHNTSLRMDLRLVLNKDLLSSNVTFRKYELDIFNIEANIATEDELKEIEKYKIYTYSNNKNIKRLLSLLRRYLNIYLIKEDSIIQENRIGGITTEININKFPNNVYLDGYWNHYSYFDDIENILRKEFTFKNSLPDELKSIEKLIIENNSISINVRRGDYVTAAHAYNYIGYLPVEYYHDAAIYISSKENNTVFFIFSDDMEWCRENIKLDNEHYFIENNYSKQKFEYDIRLISICKHNIISNSGFAWWGAWLNNNTKKIVITPQKWFKNESLQKAYETNDFFIPFNWEKIPNILKP